MPWLEGSSYVPSLNLAPALHWGKSQTTTFYILGFQAMLGDPKQAKAPFLGLRTYGDH